MMSKSMERRLIAQGVTQKSIKERREDDTGVIRDTSSIHMTHSEKTPDVSRGMTKVQTHTEKLGVEYVIEDKGHYFKISKGDRIMHVPLYAMREVVDALWIFS